jgi:ElaB/YqjD/DUF883 family membrane-anchored ribosome-binding protein
MVDSTIKGAAKKAAGRIEAAAGVLTGDASTELNGRIRELSGAAEKSFGDIVDVAEDSAAKVRDFVEQEPWKAVAVAGVIGLLVGLVVRR